MSKLTAVAMTYKLQLGNYSFSVSKDIVDSGYALQKLQFGNYSLIESYSTGNLNALLWFARV